MASTSYFTLRRFALRSLEMLERHKDRDGSLELFVETLGASATAFARALDLAQAHDLLRSDKLDGRRAAVEHLHRRLRSWTASLINDIGNLDRSRFGDNPDVPEEVIGDANALLTLLDQREQAGEALPFYAPKLRDELNASIEAAKSELRVAGKAIAAGVELRNNVRATAKTFQADLVAFRRALRAFVGTSHPDYQRLRVVRGQLAVTDDEAEVEPEPTPVGEGEIEAEPQPVDDDSTPVGDEVVQLPDDDPDEALDKAG